MRLFVIGDTHGNTRYLCNYLIPAAAEIDADVIVQLGDFGYWEHAQSGVDFLDNVSQVALRYGIPLYWLHGNHDKHSLTLERYGDRVTPGGFIECRPNVEYIPQGHIWEWAGKRMRAFGGAYSVDKLYRLEVERKRYVEALNVEGYRLKAGRPAKVVEPTAETLWFPEEEMTDQDMVNMLAADSSPMDIIFSHDRPLGAKVAHLQLKDDPECLPNQVRLQNALIAHQPDFWFHGHLHHRYMTMVRCGDDDAWTTVYGLGPDTDAAPRFWRRTDSWCVVDIGNNITVTPGADITIDGGF